MAFEVYVKASAKKDLFEAIKYYEEINSRLAQKFYNEFLAINPHLAIKYKYIRTYKLRSFPYVVHFVINEVDQIVTIIAIVFGKQQRSDFENPIQDI